MPHNKKTFWLINQYASTPETGMGGRHYYIAKELAKQGHIVYLVAASYTHLLRKLPEAWSPFTIKKEAGFNVVWVKMPAYQHAHDKLRVRNWFLFAWKLLTLGKVIPDDPDVIIYSSPSLIGSLSAEHLSKKYSAKFIFEVRDIWPLTLVEVGGKSPNHPFIRFLQWIEDRAYQTADRVLSNLPNSFEHMISRGMELSKFHWIPNGVDLAYSTKSVELPKETLKLLSSLEGKFIVGYIGTIGLANALDYLVDSAHLLKNETDISFVIVGNGNYKSSLVNKASDLKNVYFLDAVDKGHVQRLLGFFDVCYIGWNKKSLYRFGVAPNKIFDYLLASKPIIHSYSGSNDYVAMASAGHTIEAENPESIANAVLEMKFLPVEVRVTLGHNGYSYVKENHDYSKLAKKLANICLS